MQKPSTCARPPWPQLLGCALAVTLTACGGGGGGSAGSSTQASATTLSGTVVDGYLQGARVFLDANGNGQADAGEPTATTDANGRYSLDYSQVSSPVAGLRVIVTGGIDTDTGYAFTGMLTARADGSRAGQLVSPLTSLVDALVAQGLSLDDARTKVAAALGLTVADLATDPVAVLANQPGLYTRQVALQRAGPCSFWPAPIRVARRPTRRRSGCSAPSPRSSSPRTAPPPWAKSSPGPA